MKYLFTLFIFFPISQLFAQVVISDTDISDYDIARESILFLDSDNKALKLPTLSKKEISLITNPLRGMMVYNLEDNVMVYFNGINWIKLEGNTLSGVAVQNTDEEVDIIKSSYIRPNFYQNYNRIPDDILFSYNDLIFFVGSPYPNGDLYFDLPENSILENNGIEHINSYNGREGIINFKGIGSYANMQDGLLITSATGYKTFTFSTWLNLKQWTPNAKIFKKESGNIAFSLAENVGEFTFTINGITSVINTNIDLDQWHNISLVYNGNDITKVKLYIDGVEQSGINTPNNYPASTSFDRSDFILGENLNAYLDDTYINQFALSQGEISRNIDQGLQLYNTDWNSTQTMAYWTFDDPNNLGKDYQSWIVMLENIKDKIALSGKDIQIRLGMKNGNTDWRAVIGNSTFRQNMLDNIFNELQTGKWDGVDFDFEWIYNWDLFGFIPYNETIISMGNRLEITPYIFSVSLHPVAYRISQAAIDATDFISLQIYGPQTDLFTTASFIKSAEEVINYGVPKNKLVLGAPLYGMAVDGSREISYFELVEGGVITDPALDLVELYGKEYIINGQTTLSEKLNYIKNNNYKGLMTWDTATDVDISQTESLTKIINQVLN